MKILIVSGFLGAGKTTFIQEMMKRCHRQFVILENEYGSTDVDQQVLQQDNPNDVWNLTEGCVCCTKSADMNASVVTIESTLEPEFLIVEPSGVGALSNVIRNLQKIQYERIQLLRPVTILNATNFAKDYEEYGDIYQDQIKTGGTIVISQPESVDPALMDQVYAKVNEVNPDATVLPAHYTKMDDEWWNSLLTTSYDGRELQSVDESGLDLETYPIKECNIDSPVALMSVLELALRGAFGQIVRAKGLLQAGPCWVRFDIAAGVYSIVGLDEEESRDAKPDCVFIGRALDRIALKKVMLGDLCDPDAEDDDDECECGCHHHHDHDEHDHECHCHDHDHHHDEEEECHCGHHHDHHHDHHHEENDHHDN